MITILINSAICTNCFFLTLFREINYPQPYIKGYLTLFDLNNRNVYNIMSSSRLMGDNDGAEGCTFRPPLKCKDRAELNLKYGDDVMKIPIARDFADISRMFIDNTNEMKMSALIRKIDPLSKYFIALSGDSCLLDLTDEDNLQQLHACLQDREKDLIFDEIIERLNQGYFIKWGGLTLGEITNEMTKIDIRTAWEWLAHLLRGVELLSTNQISHNDLHYNNITIDPSDLKPRIIDFGKSEVYGNTASDLDSLVRLFKGYEKKIDRSSSPQIANNYDRLMKNLTNRQLSIKDHIRFIEANSEN